MGFWFAEMLKDDQDVHRYAKMIKVFKNTQRPQRGTRLMKKHHSST